MLCQQWFTTVYEHHLTTATTYLLHVTYVVYAYTYICVYMYAFLARRVVVEQYLRRVQTACLAQPPLLSFQIGCIIVVLLLVFHALASYGPSDGNRLIIFIRTGDLSVDKRSH